MSKTRSNKGQDFSNVSKTIYKQGIDGMLVYCANGPVGVISPMSKTRSNLVSEVKQRDCINMSKTIDKQGIKGSLEYCAKEPIIVIPHMYKTMQKQDIVGKWGDRSNVFKTIERKDTERSLGHGSNGQMTIGKSNFENGATYAQKWKRAEIYKRNSSGWLQAKKKNILLVCYKHFKGDFPKK